MGDLKKDVLGKFGGLGKPRRLFGLLTVLLLCACDKVPDHCGNYELLVDPLTQQCYEGKTVNKYNKLTVKTVGNGTVSRTPNNADFNYAYGTSVTLEARPAEGYEFTGWSGAYTSTSSSVLTVTVKDTMTITANFVLKTDDNKPATYAVTVSSAGTGATGGGSYAVGATVSINAGTAPSGQKFKNWTTTSAGVTFANSTNATTTFIMPSNAVTVTANFEQIPPATYAVTVTSAGTGATGGGSYAVGATVSINAGTPPTNQKFKNWTTSSAGVTFANANSAATTFTMPSNAVAVTAVFEANSVTPPGGGSYKSVVIGGKTWMAENLNIETANSWCYGDNPANCDKYGRLYTWQAAVLACQSVGWRLPTNAEWGALVTAVGSPAGTKLKSKSGWNDYQGKSGNGTDDFGFSALPGGYRRSDGDFYSAGNYGYWWTATELNSVNAYYRYMYYDNDLVHEYHDYKSYGRSVRCVQD